MQHNGMLSRGTHAYPGAYAPRPCCAGIVWLLRPGTRWNALPPPSPAPRTGWRRRREGDAPARWRQAGRAVRGHWAAPGPRAWSAAVADSRGAPATTGGPASGQPSAAQGHSGGWGSPAPVVRGATAWPRRPPPQCRGARRRWRRARLLYDPACAAAAWRQRLARRGRDLLGPPRQHRQQPLRQDGRQWRRYQRRGKVARPVAWWGNWRRLVVRWEPHMTRYRALLHVACLLMTLKQL